MERIAGLEPSVSSSALILLSPHLAAAHSSPDEKLSRRLPAWGHRAGMLLGGRGHSKSDFQPLGHHPFLPVPSLRGSGRGKGVGLSW